MASKELRRKKCPQCSTKLGKFPTKCYKCGFNFEAPEPMIKYDRHFYRHSPIFPHKKKLAVLIVALLIVASIIIFYLPGIFVKELEIIDENTGKEKYVRGLLEMIKENSPMDYDLIQTYVDYIHIKETLGSSGDYFGQRTAGKYVGAKKIYLAADTMHNETRDAGVIVHEATHAMIDDLGRCSQYKGTLSENYEEYAAHMREYLFLYNVGYYTSYEEGVEDAITRWSNRGLSIDPDFDGTGPIYSNDYIQVTVKNLEPIGIYTREWNMYYIQDDTEAFDYAVEDTVKSGNETKYHGIHRYPSYLPSGTDISDYRSQVLDKYTQDLLGVDSPFLLSLFSIDSLPYEESWLYEDMFGQSEVYYFTLTIKNIGTRTIHGGMLMVLADNYPVMHEYSHYPVYHNEIEPGESISTGEDIKFSSNQRIILELIGLDGKPICINNLFELKESQHPNYQMREYYKMINREAKQIWDNVHQKFTVDKVIPFPPQKETHTTPSGYTYNSTYYMKNMNGDDNYLYGTTAGGRLSVYSKKGEVIFEMMEDGFLNAISDTSYIYTPCELFKDMGIKVWSKIDGSLVEDNIYYKPSIYITINNGSYEKVIGCYELDDFGNYQLVFYYLPDTPAYDSVVIESIDAIASREECITLGISYKIAEYDVPGADSRISYSPLYYFLGDISKSNLSKLPSIILESNHTSDIPSPCLNITVDDGYIYYEIDNELYRDTLSSPITEVEGLHTIRNGVIYWVQRMTIDSFRPFDIYVINCSYVDGIQKEILYGSHTEIIGISSDSHHIYGLIGSSYYGGEEILVWDLL